MCITCETTIHISFRRPCSTTILGAAAASLGGRAEHYEDASTIILPVGDDLPRRWRDAVHDARIEFPMFGVADTDLECGMFGQPRAVSVPDGLAGTRSSEPGAWSC